MSEFGKKKWAIPGGHIPLSTTGQEPEFTSRDQLSILNTSQEDADIELWIYFFGGDPVGPYHIKVNAQRVRTVSFNDLIDPQALPLGEDFACVVESGKPVVVQFSRYNTGQSALATLGTMAFAGEE